MSHELFYQDVLKQWFPNGEELYHFIFVSYLMDYYTFF